jgi:hypothetical protein
LPGQDVVNEGLKCRHLNAKERKKEVNQSVKARKKAEQGGGEEEVTWATTKSLKS